jgi:hypothetical protein
VATIVAISGGGGQQKRRDQPPVWGVARCSPRRTVRAGQDVLRDEREDRLAADRQVDVAAGGQHAVAHDLGVESLRPEAPQIAVLGIGLGARAIVEARGHLVGLGHHHQLVDRLDPPAALHELHCQPVEQLGVRRRVAHLPEVLERRDDAAAEVLLPDAIDDDAGGERVSSIHRFIAPTSAEVSGSPRIGIGGASRPATWRYIWLCSALPGTNAVPCAPPSIADSRVRRSSFDSFSSSPWHPTHLTWRVGWISETKSTGCWPVGADGAYAPSRVAAGTTEIRRPADASTRSATHTSAGRGTGQLVRRSRDEGGKAVAITPCAEPGHSTVDGAAHRRERSSDAAGLTATAGRDRTADESVHPPVIAAGWRPAS